MSDYTPSKSFIVKDTETYRIVWVEPGSDLAKKIGGGYHTIRKNGSAEDKKE